MDRVECDVAAFSGLVVVASMHKAKGLWGLADESAALLPPSGPADHRERTGASLR